MPRLLKRWTGKSAHRFNREPLEKMIALAWQEENKRPNNAPGTLTCLMGDGNCPALDVTDRDRLVANTVIQWLGSQVGQDFVRRIVLSKHARTLRKGLRESRVIDEVQDLIRESIDDVEVEIDAIRCDLLMEVKQTLADLEERVRKALK